MTGTEGPRCESCGTLPATLVVGRTGKRVCGLCAPRDGRQVRLLMADETGQQRPVMSPLARLEPPITGDAPPRTGGMVTDENGPEVTASCPVRPRHDASMPCTWCFGVAPTENGPGRVRDCGEWHPDGAVEHNRANCWRRAQPPAGNGHYVQGPNNSGNNSDNAQEG